MKKADAPARTLGDVLSDACRLAPLINYLHVIPKDILVSDGITQRGVFRIEQQASYITDDGYDYSSNVYPAVIYVPYAGREHEVDANALKHTPPYLAACGVHYTDTDWRIDPDDLEIIKLGLNELKFVVERLCTH